MNSHLQHLHLGCRQQVSVIYLPSICAVPLYYVIGVYFILVWHTSCGYYSIFVVSHPVAFFSVTLPYACTAVQGNLGFIFLKGPFKMNLKSRKWKFFVRSMKQTATSGCEGFPSLEELTLSPSSGCAGGLVAPKLMTGCSTLCCIFLFGWSQGGMPPLWIVGGVNRLLHWAWAVYSML